MAGNYAMGYSKGSNRTSRTSVITGQSRIKRRKEQKIKFTDRINKRSDETNSTRKDIKTDLRRFLGRLYTYFIY